MGTLLGTAGLFSTIAVYGAVRRLYRRFPHFLLTPILISPLILLLLLAVSQIPYETYNRGADWLTFLLKPATVAFAVPIYKHFDMLKKHVLEIVGSIIVGSAAGIATSMVMGRLLGMNAEVVSSLAPRSVTTPIAMEIANMWGANPTLTAVFVIITGLFGFLAGPAVIRFLRVKSPVAKGMLIGMSAHGVGTSKAFEMGQEIGTASSVAMVLAAVVTFLLAPWLIPLLL